MAGLPDPVIARAREILVHLEGQDLKVSQDRQDAQDGRDGEVRAKSADADAVPDLDESRAAQMNLFGQPDPVAEELKEKLQDLDTDRMTPIEALVKLSELKRLLEEST